MRLLTDVVTRVTDPYLRHAASLALRAAGRTAPNPLVGCVIVRDDRVVGTGFHPRAGEPHAEVFALAAAGDEARGADAYVTLEPCAHFGRTPPCAEALISAGVKRVVIGMVDPNAEAAGGAVRLREAGIDVEFAQDARPFELLNEGWLHRIATGRPFVTVKLGLTLDAHLSLTAGERAAITGHSGAEITRALRDAADAVLVGATTVTVDDPSLTRRDADGVLAEEQPLRVVVSRTTLPPEDSRVFTDGHAPTLFFATGDELVSGFGHQVLVERLPSGASLTDVISALGARGVSELLVEAGPRLFGGLMAEGLVDQLVTVTAGGFAGSGAPQLALEATKVTESELDRVLAPLETGIVGDVVATAWRPRARIAESL